MIGPPGYLGVVHVRVTQVELKLVRLNWFDTNCGAAINYSVQILIW